MEQHYDPPPFQIPVPGTQPTANLTSPTEAYQMQQRTPTHPYPNHPSNGGYSHTSFQQDQRPTANGGGEVIQSPQNGGYFQFDSETAIERVEVAPQPVSQPGQEPRRERTLRRELNSYQITMITLGGTFGTGLLVASGTALNEGGPLGLLISFLFVGFICFCMMTSLCEMATFLPHKKGFVGLVTRYVHPAVGFGLGWTYLCQFMFVPPSHINTAAIVMTYINNTIDINGNAVESRNPVPSWAWRLIFIFIVTSVNFLGIRSFGRLELLLSSFKILVLIALIIFGLVVDLGGARLITGGFDPIHGRNWRPPFGPMGHGLSNELNPGSAGQFLGFWATMVRVLFAFEGIELIGVVIGEAANPRRNVPRAIKQTYTLVIGLYVITSIIIGLICPSNSPTLTNRILSHEGQVSPFIVAAHLLAAKALVPVINAAIIVFALSGTISNLYTGSRTLYGLALDKQAPKILRRVTVGGRPLLALSLCVIWCFLSYLGQNEKRPNYTFDYFVDLTTTAGSVSWICIFWAHIRFRKALKLQGINLRELTYLAPLHPYGTWFSLVASTIFTIFKGHESFVKRRAGGFITAYILIAFFAVLIAGWKFYHPEDHFVNLGRVDLQEGGRDQDLALEERQQLEQDQEHQRQEQHGNGLRRRTNLPWLMGERNGDTP